MDDTQKRAHEEYDRALYFVDRILPLAHSFAPFNISYIALYETKWPQQEKEEANDLRMAIHRILIGLK